MALAHAVAAAAHDQRDEDGKAHARLISDGHAAHDDRMLADADGRGDTTGSLR